MTKSTSATTRLPVKTVVVHNYGEFTHGVIVGHTENAYVVYFPADMCPDTPKYRANTVDAIKTRQRTITHGKGFFVSRFKTLADVRAAQEKCKLSGLDLEGNKI
jgi:hypothetical protein